MSITPQEGYIIDPNNPNGVIQKPLQTEVQISQAEQAARGLGFGSVASASTALGVPTTISSATLTPASPVTLPPTPQSSIPVVPPVEPPLPPPPPPSAFEQRQSELQAEALKTQESLGGRTASQFAAENAQNKPEYQRQVNDLTAQVKALQYESQAIPLQIQNEITGKGITKAGTAILQADALRTNAIKALSTSALLQAAQGNLSLSQQLADRAVEAEFAPQEAKLKWLEAAIDMNYKNLTREDQKRADAQRIALEERTRILGEQKSNKSIAQALATSAVKNDPTASGAAQEALKLDPSDPDYISKVYGLLGKYQTDPAKTQKDLDDHLRSQADIAYTYAQIAEIKDKNAILSVSEAKALGVPYGTTKGQAQALGKIPGSADVTPEVLSERSDTINLINSVLVDPQLKNAVGIRKLNPWELLPGTPEKAVKAQLSQIVAKLALSNRAKLKGSGTISDFESRTLERSASAFNTNLSYGAAKDALVQVRGALTTMNGGSSTITIYDPKTKKYQDAVVSTDDRGTSSDKIAALIKDGYVINYK